jgi:tetratricopeptide (TPR) repeat protein
MFTIGEMFNQAVLFHQRGQLAQAEPLYRQIIEINPNHADAHHLLGLLARQSGQRQAAGSLIQRAISLNPRALAFHFNLGMVFLDLGQPAEAARCFRQELALNPRHAESFLNLGIALAGQGLYDDAANSYRQVLSINPTNADAHNNLGITLVMQKQFPEATQCFQDALRSDPDNVNAYINLGNVLKDQKRWAEAAECYRQALRRQPEHANAHNNLGLALFGLGDSAAAIRCYRDAIRIAPDYASAYNNLGNTFQHLKQTEDAADSYRRALRINPNHANAQNNLGIVLFVQGKLAEAIACFRHALVLNPQFADALVNLGSVFVVERNFAEAAECFRQATVVDPGHKIALWNRGLLSLLQGDFANGWPDHELRVALPWSIPRTFEQPRWDGSPLDGKTVLVYADAGLGDTIQFARFLPMVKERGGNVVFECQPALALLLEGIQGVDRVVAAGVPTPPFDVQIPLLSLPLLFEITLDNLPPKVPYVAVDPKSIEKWSKKLARKNGLYIGIVWQGSQNQNSDLRSTKLKYFESVACLAGVHVVSLQVGPGSVQLADTIFPIIDLGGSFDRDSMEDMAAAMMNLDLVVTVDTSAAHLAGALGIPVWVALSYVSCWRWLLDRADSPWYPTMRLFRQCQFGDWHDVFKRIAAELPTFSAVSPKRLICAPG